jgi:vacuolar-type H+-ATPase subunit E/Vma4
MGHHELLAALTREGDLKADAIRSASDAEVLRLRKAAAARMSELRHTEEHRQERTRADRRQDILAEAARVARLIRLAAEYDLAVHLREVADSSLSALRAEGYAQLFRSLAAELPGETWETVRVNPLDAALARELFPEAVIESSSGITGGFVAITGNMDFTVDNTLDVRLKRIWPAVLPDMIAELRRDMK